LAIASYADLKTSIAAWTHRSDLTSYLDDFIDLTEAMFKSEPRPPDDPDIGGLRVEITTATGTLTAGQDYIAKPADFLSPISFSLTGENGGRAEFVNYSAMDLKAQTTNGKPKFWTVTDNLDFDRSPDSAYAYELKYWSQPDALDGSTTTNTVTANYPEVYLAGCLYNAFDFIHDDQNAAKWLARYKAYAWSASRTFHQSTMSQGAISAFVA